MSATHGKHQKHKAKATFSHDELSTTQATSLLFSITISIRWRDLDALNHVNNSTFLTYLEEARLVWLSQIKGPWFTETYMPVLAACNVNYRRQLEWPGNVVVELYCIRVGNSSITLAHRIVASSDPNLLYADGDAVIVWVEPETGRSIALPEAIRLACQ